MVELIKTFGHVGIILRKLSNKNFDYDRHLKIIVFVEISLAW